jgi:hypothetical protein
MSENMQTCPSCGELVPIEYVICVWCGFDLTAEHIRRSGIRIGPRQAALRARKVVVDPLNAFREIALIPDLTGGKLIFYLIGMAMTLNMITVLSKINGLQFNEVNADVVAIGSFGISINFVLNLAFLIVQPLVLYLIFLAVWKVAARILSLFSRSVGGRGDKIKIRAAIGYSMLPVLFAWTLSWLLRLITPSEDINVATQNITYQDVDAAVVAFSEQGFGVVSQVVMWIGWIWALVLGVIGMRYAARLSYIEAAIVAGIPYALFMTIVL